MYLCHSLFADLWENYDSLPAKINNKIVQQYEQNKHRRTGIVEQTIQICENVYSKDWRRVLKRG